MQSQQLSEEWFANRVGRITGSRAGAVLGDNPWQSRKQVLVDMVDEARGNRKDLDNVPAIKYGKENEARAIAAFEFLTDKQVTETGFHTIGDWGGASPDGLIDDNAILEVKCPYGLRDSVDALDFKSIHDQPHYYAQVQMELHATDRDNAYFFQWAEGAHQLEIVPRQKDWLDLHMDYFVSFIHDYENALEIAGDAPTQADLANMEIELFDLISKKEEFLKTVDGPITELKEAIANLSGGIYKGTRLSVQKQLKQGNVSYRKVAEEFAPEDIDLDEYRGKPSESIVVRKIGESK